MRKRDKEEGEREWMGWGMGRESGRGRGKGKRKRKRRGRGVTMKHNVSSTCNLRSAVISAGESPCNYLGCVGIRAVRVKYIFRACI